MSFLIDTSVVSEWVRPRPDPGIMAWLAAADEDRIFLSVMTFAEIGHGIERLAGSSRKKRLDGWLREELPLRFEGRILDIDPSIADAWGVVISHREAMGRPIGVVDGFIAATANVHGLALVTRNVSDFEAVVPQIINPWTS